VFTDYDVSGGSLTGSGRATVDDYLFLYAVDDSGYRSITEEEWLVDVYDMLLKKWIKILTEDKLSLMNEKTPADYSDGDFSAADPDGFPGPTVACLWDEMTDLGYDEQTRREFAFDELPESAREPADEGEWTTAESKNYMLEWYLDRLEKRFAQTFDVAGDDEEFDADERTEWSELIREVKEYPDWATAEHITEYELGDQSVYLRAQRYVKLTQDVSSDECTTTTVKADYDDYRNDLREWLLWSFCANIEGLKTSYKGETVDFEDNLSGAIVPDRCHTLNFMLDYLTGDDAPHTELHDVATDFSNNYENEELKVAYIKRLDDKKTALVARLDDPTNDIYDAKSDELWPEYVSFRNEFELIFGEVEIRINMEFSAALDTLVDDNELTFDRAE